jgi:hypothetical protein
MVSRQGIGLIGSTAKMRQEKQSAQYLFPELACLIDILIRN